MKIKNNHLKLALYFLAFSLLTLVFLTIYAVGQQIIRQTANDPQIQIAEDSAAYLSRGGTATDFDNPNKTDMAQSLTPFLMVYSLEGKPLASSGQLSGKMPFMPLGVLEAAARGENRVTWQPTPSLRFALVVHPIAGQNAGYVAVGRSLREIEIREDNLLKISALAWLAGIILLLALIAGRELKQRM